MEPKGVGQIIVEQLAISSVAGSAVLVAGPDFATNEGTASIKVEGAEAGTSKVVAVKTTTLTQALSGHSKVGIIKIDVEGHELEVFKGSLDLLSENAIRDIVFEDAVGAIDQIADLLWSYGYSIYVIEETLFCPILKPIRNKGELPLGYSYANYLATIDPDRAVRLLAKPGWRVMRLKPVG